MVKLERAKTKPAANAEAAAINNYIKRKLHSFSTRRAFEPAIERLKTGGGKLPGDGM